MQLRGVPYDKGDLQPFALDPRSERGKARTKCPGVARSTILALSLAGCSQVSVSSMISLMLSYMKVDMSDLLLDVPLDLALKMQMGRGLERWKNQMEVNHENL